MNSVNNKRIAKNTMFLYIRTIVIMLVTLYISRIILNELGVVDYGIYNVVGGIVLMLSFLNGAMITATQRFLNYEMGSNGSEERLREVFSVSLIIHLVISGLILILAESIGLWFLNSQLNIVPSKMYAANWVYQFSIFTAVLSIIQSPYNALIVANERMNIYGIIGLVEAILKLSVAFLLLLFSSDKLIIYSLLIFLVSLTIIMIYNIYCRRNFVESNFNFSRNIELYKEILTFSAWNLFGNGAFIVKTQGRNILLNIFFGAAINAAGSIATSVSGAISSLVSNFMTAARPQIVKCYASQEYDHFYNLVARSSKFSFFLLFIFSVPVLLQTDYILTLWLKNPPEYSVLFCQLTLIDAMIVSISYALMTAVSATGRIKQYQLIVAILELMNLPVAYFFLKLGYNSSIVYRVTIVISFFALFARLYVLHNLMMFPIWQFIRDVILRCSAIVGVVFALLFLFIQTTTTDNILGLIWKSSLYVLLSICVTVVIGMTKVERLFIFNTVYSKLKRK